MEWIKNIIDSITISELTPHMLIVAIIAIIGLFGMSAFKAHYKHIERLEKIKQGLDPES